jgi:hypothetical protein
MPIFITSLIADINHQEKEKHKAKAAEEFGGNCGESRGSRWKLARNCLTFRQWVIRGSGASLMEMVTLASASRTGGCVELLQAASD